ncbi:MAG: sigma-70 family RNA polymerase sigma factor [Thermoanaerobaculia bacterium]|nr:sigma-70 family RNA polymerase sigma factor [Thermoanaerobaculia bacterium]
MTADVTDLLQSWGRGDAAALEKVIPLVYERLCTLASGFLSQERKNHTLQTAALVNEAYLRMQQLEHVSWNDRAHFFALSARFMRRILIDHGRRVRSDKRGGDAPMVGIEMAEGVAFGRPEELLALDQALRDLAEHDRELAQIVELRYFGGLSREEIATVLGIGSATVTRRWRLARAWLFQQLKVDGPT